jgi:ABC-type multidrug transport system ATPase subunit
MQTELAIETDGIEKRSGATRAVAGVSLSVRRGKV